MFRQNRPLALKSYSRKAAVQSKLHFLMKNLGLIMKKQAYTLLELSIVVIILGIIAGYGIPKIIINIDKSYVREAVNQLQSFYAINNLFYTNKGIGEYFDPGSTEDCPSAQCALLLGQTIEQQAPNLKNFNDSLGSHLISHNKIKYIYNSNGSIQAVYNPIINRTPPRLIKILMYSDRDLSSGNPCCLLGPGSPNMCYIIEDCP